MLRNHNAIESEIGYQITNSLRFNLSSSQSLTDTFVNNNTSFTFSAWVKRGAISSANDQHIFSIDGSNGLAFDTGNSLKLWLGSATSRRTSTQVFRDPSSWYHIVMSRNGGQGGSTSVTTVYVNNVEIFTYTGNGGTYTSAVTHRLGHNSGASGYFDGYMAEIYYVEGYAWTPAAFAEYDANNQWVAKKYTGFYGVNGFYLPFNNGTSTTTLGLDNTFATNRLTNSQLIGGTGWTLNTATAGTNNVVAPDGTTTASTITGTGADSYTIQSFTAVSGTTYTFSVWLKSTSNTTISILAGPPNWTLTSCNLTTSWQRFSVTFTANGTGGAVVIGGNGSLTSGEIVHAWGAQVEIASTAGVYRQTLSAASPAPVNWTLNNFVRSNGATDCWMLDVPSGNGSIGVQPNSNYPVMNPIQGNSTGGGANGSTSNTNLTATTSVGTGSGVGATMAVNGGKFYWEVTLVSGVTTASVACQLGLAERSAVDGLGAFSAGRYDSTDTPTYTNGDTISFAYDGPNNTLFCYKNNVLAKTITGVSSGLPLIPSIRDNISTAIVANFNFGQRAFTYTPPSGYVALCTANLPTSTILNGQKYFDISLYTGNGGNQNITGINFQPDMFWGKSRSTVNNHGLVDVIRGGLNALYSNLTNIETSDGVVTAWNSNGVSLGNSATTNSNGTSYVGWMWKAGDSTVTNTSGTISSQVRANTTSGFSIVSYTGNATLNATVGHGLGIAPKVIIIKNRSVAQDWVVYTTVIDGSLDLLRLNTTAAKADSSANLPTSSVFSLSAGADTNGSGNAMIAYCFSEIPGFSAFGRYTGNGNSNGPFVYTGFKPRYVMIKRDASATNWIIKDTSRSPLNQNDPRLRANTTDAEASSSDNIDILSNGFKCRTTGESNNSGSTHIYMAFAENPFAQSNAE